MELKDFYEIFPIPKDFKFKIQEKIKIGISLFKKIGYFEHKISSFEDQYLLYVQITILTYLLSSSIPKIVIEQTLLNDSFLNSLIKVPNFFEYCKIFHVSKENKKFFLVCFYLFFEASLLKKKLKQGN